MYTLNNTVKKVTASPVAEAQSWLKNRQFPPSKPLLDVAQAVPGYPPAAELQHYLATQVTQPETAFYTPIFGLPALREALAEHMNAVYRTAIDTDHVAIVAGCNQGFCASVMALAASGDEIILPLPYYFNHQMWVEMLGARAVPLPFDERAGGLPAVSAAAERITARTRAIALVSPNNPTGAVYPAELLADFYQLAQRHGIALIVDETYKDFRTDTSPPHGLFQDPAWPQTLIQLYSFSKAFSLTGYRVGSVIAAPDLLQEIGKFQDCVAICAPHIGQQAALYGLTRLHDWCAEKRHLMARRADALRALFAQDDLHYRLIACGAYFAYVKHPFTGEQPLSATTVAQQLLAEQHILCLPGTTFGPGQDAYLRLAFANLDEAQIAELGRRLIASQQSLSPSPARLTR